MKALCVRLVKIYKFASPMGLLGYSGKFALMALLVMAITLAGCDLFLNKPEIDMGNRIDDAVAYKNAPDVAIVVRSRSVEEGISSPNGQVAAKQGYPITVQFAVSADYAFIEWEAVTNFSAYRTAADREARLEHLAPEGSITVVDYRLDLDGNRTGEASIIVNTTEALTLVPYCVRRPYVVTHNLPNNFTDYKDINYPIEIRFNKPLDPDCYTGAAWKENFIISAVTQFGTSTPLPPEQMEGLFDEPEMNGKVLTIKQVYDPGNIFFRNCAITVSLNKAGIRSKAVEGGEPSVTMGEVGYYDLLYSVGSSGYTGKPTIDTVAAALSLDATTIYKNPLGGSYATASAPFVKNEDGDYVVYLLYNVEIEPRVSLRDVHIEENGRTYTVHAFSKYEATGLTDNPPAVQKYFADNVSKTVCYMTRYVLEKREGGLPETRDADQVVALTILPGDNLGNYAVTAGAVSVYLDAEKPDVSAFTAKYMPNNGNIQVSWKNPPDVNLNTIKLVYTKAGGSPTTVDVSAKKTEDHPSYVIPSVNVNDEYTVELITKNYSGVEASQLKTARAISGYRYVASPYYGHVSGNGLSWATASNDLQKMIDQAYAIEQEYGTDGVVYVAGGTYKPQYAPGPDGTSVSPGTSGTTAKDATFILRQGVEMYGGYDSNNPATTSEDDRLTHFHPDGTYSSNQVYLDGSVLAPYHVVLGVDIGPETVLDGFTIGQGGDYNSNTRLTVKGRSIERNSGGGMYNAYSSPTLKYVLINDNSNTGGMYNDHSSPVLTNVVIQNNSARCLNNTPSGSRGSGGGMYNYYSSPVLTNVIIYQNSASPDSISSNADGGGGGMYNYNSSPVLTDVRITDNNAESSNGGGMYNAGSSSPTLTNVIISGNRVYGKGIGMYNAGTSKPILINVLISGNETQLASSKGVGMYNAESSEPKLINVTISGNLPQNGATVGGMYSAASSRPKIYNSIIWGTHDDFSYEPGCTLDIKNSIVQHSDYTSTVDANGNLNPASGVFDSDYKLITASPAIDAGDNSRLNAAQLAGKDLAGNNRKVGSSVDMGAYEKQ
jgi:hypothetical protein